MTARAQVMATKRKRRRPMTEEWRTFPKLLNDPLKEAAREGREMAKEILADLDRDLEKDRKRKPK